jgi:hypothetical protein
MVNGACVTVDPVTRKPIPEAERVARILERTELGGLVERGRETAGVGTVIPQETLGKKVNEYGTLVTADRG